MNQRPPRKKGAAQKRRETIADVVAKIKERRKKRPDIVIEPTVDDYDRYGRPNSIAATVKCTPLQYSASTKSRLPRFATLDASKINAWHNPTFKSKDRAAGPGQYDIGRFSSLSVFDPPRSSHSSNGGNANRSNHRMDQNDHGNYNRHMHQRSASGPRARGNYDGTGGNGATPPKTAPAAFGSRDRRFKDEKYEPEPTYKPVILPPTAPESPKTSFAKSPRFFRPTWKTAVHYGRADGYRLLTHKGTLHGDGAFDQMYDVDKQTALSRSIAYNPMKYTMKGKASRFSTSKAIESGTFRTPNIKAEVKNDMGPGYYDPPRPTVRVKSAKRLSSTFRSETPRFSFPFWGNSTPIEAIHLAKTARESQDWELTHTGSASPRKKSPRKKKSRTSPSKSRPPPTAVEGFPSSIDGSSSNMDFGGEQIVESMNSG